MMNASTDDELMAAIRDLEAIEDELSTVHGMTEFRERISQIRMAVVDSELQRITHELNTDMPQSTVHLGDIAVSLLARTDLSQRTVADILDQSTAWVAKQSQKRTNGGQTDAE